MADYPSSCTTWSFLHKGKEIPGIYLESLSTSDDDYRDFEQDTRTVLQSTTYSSLLPIFSGFTFVIVSPLFVPHMIKVLQTVILIRGGALASLSGSRRTDIFLYPSDPDSLNPMASLMFRSFVHPTARKYRRRLQKMVSSEWVFTYVHAGTRPPLFPPLADKASLLQVGDYHKFDLMNEINLRFDWSKGGVKRFCEEVLKLNPDFSPETFYRSKKELFQAFRSHDTQRRRMRSYANEYKTGETERFPSDNAVRALHSSEGNS